jgi:NADP-dependent 3-hydroxy acid dehydrogenase YdfG
MEHFNGKVVIVTGAASGTGDATARRFSSEGANVALVDRNKDALAKICAGPAQGADDGLPPDVSRSDMADAMVSAVVERFGRLDILIQPSFVSIRKNDEIVRFLTTNLNEEKAANTKLNTVALAQRSQRKGFHRGMMRV